MTKTIDALMEALDWCIAEINRDSPASINANAALALARAEQAEPIAWATDESLAALRHGGNGSRGTVPMHASRSHVAKHPLYTTPPAPVQAVEPQRPDIVEKLTYHALERDDLTLDDCLAYLAKGWYDVRGRTERQMVLQLTALLAAAPPPPPRCPSETSDSEEQAALSLKNEAQGAPPLPKGGA